jgi:hypothetical protein
MLLLFALLVVMAWGYDQVFTGRAALLHLGAFTATIMSANVFFIIIPNQKIVVADLKAGRTPDPKYGKIAKLRSTHNNYLTLPVVFLMLSNHYPLAFATEWNWVIASLVFLMGVTIRHFFNSMHARNMALVDLGRHGRDLHRHHVAVDGRTNPILRRGRGTADDAVAERVFAEAQGFEDVHGSCWAAVRCAMRGSRRGTGSAGRRRASISSSSRTSRGKRGPSTFRPASATPCRPATSPGWSPRRGTPSSGGTAPRPGGTVRPEGPEADTAPVSEVLPIVFGRPESERSRQREEARRS